MTEMVSCFALIDIICTEGFSDDAIRRCLSIINLMADPTNIQSKAYITSTAQTSSNIFLDVKFSVKDSAVMSTRHKKHADKHRFKTYNHHLKHARKEMSSHKKASKKSIPRALLESENSNDYADSSEFDPSASEFDPSGDGSIDSRFFDSPEGYKPGSLLGYESDPEPYDAEEEPPPKDPLSTLELFIFVCSHKEWWETMTELDIFQPLARQILSLIKMFRFPEENIDALKKGSMFFNYGMMETMYFFQNDQFQQLFRPILTLVKRKSKIHLGISCLMEIMANMQPATALSTRF